jgi:5-methylcytosine-specific restriction endonuclease McrA
MKKVDRQRIFDKYGGRCAYCGCELLKGWHVDEVEPVRRNKVWNIDLRRWETNKEKPFEHPERMCIENQNPACASCNINKHSESLEDFRKSIKKYVESLNLYSTQYKIAKRYGLIMETGIEVKFYFETLNQPAPATNQ